jgi:hypothetical protein
MPVEAAAGHLAALARLGVAAEGVHIGGGEPFGDFERLLAIVRAARAAGVGYVETNGFWATSEGIVRERVGALAEAGMRQLAISADPYHQEFVPPERVALLYRVARQVLGPDGVRARRWRWLETAQDVAARLACQARPGKPAVAHPFAPVPPLSEARPGEPAVAHPFAPIPPLTDASCRDVAAMPETERLALFRSFLGRYPERMTGRAADCLAALADRTPVERLAGENCRQALLESGHVHVDAAGWVYPGTCAGIVLGRATAQRPLDEVVRGWRLGGSPLAASLVEGGPARLLDVAARSGFRPDAAGYAGKCHLCWSIRRHVVGRGGGDPSLEPAALYLTS